MPDAPINLEEVTISRDHSHLGLSWSEGFHDGGEPVTEYVVSWGSNSESTTDTSYTVGNLEGAKDYTFYVQSKNSVGLSERSEGLTLSTDPSPPPIVTLPDCKKNPDAEGCEKKPPVVAIVIIVVIVVLVIAIGVTIALIVVREKSNKKKAQREKEAKYKEAQKTEQAVTERDNQVVSTHDERRKQQSVQSVQQQQII